MLLLCQLVQLNDHLFVKELFMCHSRTFISGVLLFSPFGFEDGFLLLQYLSGGVCYPRDIQISE